MYYKNQISDKLTNKPQFFAFYDNAKKITNDQLILLKGGANYIKYIKQEEAITEFCDIMMKKDCINYNPEGYSIEECIRACMSYDTTIIKKSSHPKTNADILNSAQMALKEAIKKKNIKPLTDDNISE